MKMYSTSHTSITAVVIHPTTGFRSRRNSLRPMKNKRSASCRSIGSAAASSNTLHFTRPSCRKNRRRRCESGDWLSWAIYSWNHCFTSIAREAVIKANTRLQDQSVLIRTEETGATKGGGEKAGTVELIKLPATERLANWSEIWRSISLDASPESGSNFVYVSTTKVVNTAEKRPA